MYKKFAALLLALIASLSLFAQLTLRVTAIPANTPPGASIYVAGTFNNWNPADATKILAPQPDGSYKITITPPTGQVKFKFTRGSWSTVEGNATGGFLPDRTLNYNGTATTVNLTILSWEGSNSGSTTAAANVVLLDDDFYMPQLNRTRKIWLYLPPDYNSTAQKHYPVLYMHDGQNLFDKYTTAFGTEWEVDESLNALFAAGDYGCIVVGIENGGQYRLDEYSPWVNPNYGGGQGDEYVDFIVNNLKPFVDANYRTLPGPSTTGIMGSSMGGLISMYAFSERQDIFSRAGIFSPAFWFAGNNSASHTASHPKLADARVYFLAGGDEPQSVETNMNVVADAMLTAGFTSQEIYWDIPNDGEHSEWFWAREFPDAYEWLFDGVVKTRELAAQEQLVGIYPNPSGAYIRFSGFNPKNSFEYRIISAAGKTMRDSTQRAGEPVYTGDLPAGLYIVKVREKGTQKWFYGKLSR